MTLPSPLDLDPIQRQEVDARVGQTLSQRYTLEEVIDVGGTCAVYRGMHRNGNRVAVKVLHGSTRATPEARKAFLEASYTANRVEHPAAARVLDDDTTEDGTAYVVLDLLEGQSLATMLQRSGGGMSEKALVPLMTQLCDVLTAAHAKGVAHRALSPRKLFIDKNRTLHVFGFGKPQTEAEFMAPEQARGEPPDALTGALTDIWATGAVMFHALSGQAVYAAESAEQTKELAKTRPAPQLLTIVSGVDGDLAAIVDRALFADKDDRWKSAAAMATALRAPLGAAMGTKTMAMMASAPPPGMGGPPVLTELSPQMPSAPPPPVAAAPTQFGPPSPFAPPPQQQPYQQPPPPPYGQPQQPYNAGPSAYPPMPQRSGSKAWIAWVLALVFLVVVVFGGIAVGGFLFFRAKAKVIAAKEKEKTELAAAHWSDSESPVPVTYLDPMWGQREAPVTIVMFGDFQCPFCARAVNTLAEVKTSYGPEQVRIIWKNEPLAFHLQAKPAAEAAQAVFVLKGSNAFFQWHDLAFKNQAQLNADSYRTWAIAAGVKGEDFDTELGHTASLDKKIDDDHALAKAISVTGTPSFRINGIELSGAQPLSKFKTVIDGELAKAKAEVASGTAKNKLYVVLSKANYQTKQQPADTADAPVVDSTTVWRVPVTGSPSLGNADAPVTIVMFGDFQCPFCKKSQATLRQVQATYGDKVRLVWKDNPLPFHVRAEPAAQLARDVRTQKGDAAFWKAHDALFDASPSLEDDDLLKVASQVGADPAKVKAAIAGHKHRKEIEADQELAEDLEANSTPVFFVNGRRIMGAQPFAEFEKLIDDELKKFDAAHLGSVAAKDYYASIMRDAKAPPEPEKKKAPPFASNQPYRGGKNAKVVIQEWSDFQCPFCSRVEPTLAQIAKDYGDKVKIVWHDKPLPMHPDAPIAAEAAREAYEQKGNTAFWLMHDTLYANQKNLKRDDLDSYAQTQGLDMKKWGRALDGLTHKSVIDADDQAGTAAGISGTPSFFINDYYLSGAQPYLKFKRLIDRALSEVR